MSMPKFPELPDYTICESLNALLNSIAVGELSLSHILNAEGEAIQYILGTLRNCTSVEPSFCEIVSLNKSIEEILNLVTQNRLILKNHSELVIKSLKEFGCTVPCKGRDCSHKDKCDCRITNCCRPSCGSKPPACVNPNPCNNFMDVKNQGTLMQENQMGGNQNQNIDFKRYF